MVRRFHFEGVIEEGRPCLITGPEARHILNVLRMRPGDRLALMDHLGSLFEGIIDSVTRHGVTVILEKPLPSPPPSSIEIILLQAVLKSGPMDVVIQKTSELGVGAIFPFFSERTVVRLEKERSASRLRRWNEIAKSAAKQCGRSVQARIAAPTSLGELLDRWKGEDGLKALLWEEEGQRDLRGLLRCSQQSKRFIGVIGPEGGLSEEEVKTAEAAGFVPVSLGTRILRAETSAIVMVALAQYEWGDLGLSGRAWCVHRATRLL